MTKFKKKIFEITATLCIIFLVFVCALSSYAWFSTNRTVKSTGQLVKIGKNTDLGVAKLQIYKRFGADKAKDVSNDREITLTEYDTVFTDKNVNTSIIMRLELVDLPYENGKYLPFHLRVKCLASDSYVSTLSQGSSMTTQDAEDEWVKDGAIIPVDYWQTNGQISEVLSNIIGLRCGLGDSTLNGYTEPDDIYSYAKTYLETKTAEQTFLNVVGTEKKGIIVFDFEDYEKYLTNGKVVVYIDINYNDKLIGVYSGQHGISTSSGDETGGSESINFVSDLSNCFIFLEGSNTK